MAIRRNQKRKGRFFRESSSSRPDDDCKDRVSSIYADMISEATAGPNVKNERPSKRRREFESDSSDDYAQDESTSLQGPSQKSKTLKAPVQTVYNDSPSDDSDDFDWEEVDLDTGAIPSGGQEDDARTKVQDVSIVLGKNETVPRKNRTSMRLPSSAADKKLRLEIHKLHLCCLLTHLHIRNAWCNDRRVQALLKPLLSRRTVSYLNPEKSLSQFQQSRSFVDGLQQTIDAWKPLFKITERGTRRANWIKDTKGVDEIVIEQDTEALTSLTDFIESAKLKCGSRDTGAQLFCALLRSVGVDARLVCSLQPLQFTSPPSVSAPVSSKKTIIHADELGRDSDDDVASQATYDRGLGESSGGPSRIRRLGQVSASSARDLGKALESLAKHKKIVDSPYPIYWIEAFNEALQRWIPTDPLVTGTIAKPTKFEPPANDSLNDMTYVVAFEDDGNAKDVTRRYAKAYNAKTRRRRIEISKNGRKWWKKVMKTFDDGLEADRDQVEDAELANREASESIPRNVQDFKDHPFYALERHLRHNEIIHPRQEVGKLSTGKTSSAIESIYRRKHVQIVRSADSWYREGRQINPGEQPLKYANRRRRRLRDSTPDLDTSENEDRIQQGVGLYAEFQTDLYVPPPVVKGKIPKNDFGNLDVYVPTMIPPGGVHVRVKEAGKAAQILRVDYAEVVTGFEFRGRHGTAIINGVVVAQQYQDAVEEVVRGLRWQEEQAAAAKRASNSLRLWKRFWTGLKIRERVMAYATDGEEEQEMEVRMQLDDMETEEKYTKEEGGFFPDQGSVQSAPHVPRASSKNMGLDIENSTHPELRRSNVGTEENNDFDYFPPSVCSPWDRQRTYKTTPKRQNSSPKAVPELVPLLDGVNDFEGGFLPEDDKEGTDIGGGFIPEYANVVNDQEVTADKVKRVKQQVGQASAERSLTERPSTKLQETETRQDRNQVSSSQEEPLNSMINSSPVAQKPTSDMAAVASEPVSLEIEQFDNVAENKDEDVGNVTKRADNENNDDADDDATSLLSQDPEDEEAEPEWLANDVGL